MIEEMSLAWIGAVIQDVGIIPEPSTNLYFLHMNITGPCCEGGTEDLPIIVAIHVGQSESVSQSEFVGQSTVGQSGQSESVGPSECTAAELIALSW